MTALTLAMCLSASLPAAAAAPVHPAAVASTATVRTEVSVSTVATIGSLYPVGHLRDPFTHWGAGRGRVRAFSLENFDIHKLSLRAIMRDAGSDFALFVDNDAGASLLLRKGRLFDPKKRLIPGVTGVIEIKKKRVTLTAPEGDVQVFRLGEEEKD